MKKIIILFLMCNLALTINVNAQRITKIFGFSKDTTMGSSQNLAPNEYAVKAYVDKSVAGTDTNTLKIGKILQNSSYREIPFSLDSYTSLDSININKNTNKSVYIDRLESTYNFAFSTGYKLECDEKSNVNYYINVWKNNGLTGLRFDCGKSNALSEKSSNIININRYESDSTLAVNGAYMSTLHYFRKLSNKTILLNYNQMICNVASQLIYSGYNMTNSLVEFNIKQFFTKIPVLQTSYSYSGDYGTIHGGIASLDNSTVIVNMDLAKTGGNVAPINIANSLTNYSTIIIRIKNADKYYGTDIPFIQISASTDATSKIIIEGNFTTKTGPCVKISSNANVLLDGTFETKSSTFGAIQLTATASNVKVHGLLKTGYTESITAASAMSISILPGSSANKAVGSNVTQVGGTLTVNSGF